MSFSLVRILVPTAVGATVYITVKIFDSKTPSQKGFVSKTKTTGIKKIVKKITQDRALKFALISILATVGVQYFYQQIGTILLQEALNKESGKTGPLQVFVDLVEEHNIALHSKSIKSLISTPNHSRDEKVELLKIKLDFIINNIAWSLLTQVWPKRPSPCVHLETSIPICIYFMHTVCIPWLLDGVPNHSPFNPNIIISPFLLLGQTQ